MNRIVSHAALVLALAGLAVAPCALRAAEPVAIDWKLDQTAAVGGRATEVVGAPKVVEIGGIKAVRFDGAADGLYLPVNPVAGLREFTIEVLFRPESGGSEEQRFLHLQDEPGSRGLLEIRLTPAGLWALDTFLSSVPTQSNLPLLDRTKTHPADRWYWVALRYDGKTMTSFVDGVQELAGPVNFAPTQAAGRISLGVRQNKISWFKGAIAEVRIAPAALPAEKLQRTGAK